MNDVFKPAGYRRSIYAKETSIEPPRKAWRRYCARDEMNDRQIGIVAGLYKFRPRPGWNVAQSRFTGTDHKTGFLERFPSPRPAPGPRLQTDFLSLSQNFLSVSTCNAVNWHHLVRGVHASARKNKFLRHKHVALVALPQQDFRLRTGMSTMIKIAASLALLFRRNRHVRYQ